MAIVQSVDGLRGSSPEWSRPGGSIGGRLGVELYGGTVADYAAIYRTQPNIRIVVRFIARNIASLPLKGYRKLGPNVREELAPGHELADLLVSPFPAAPKPPSRHRFVRTLIEDVAVFDRWYALKVRNPGTRQMNLVRLPPQIVNPRGNSIVGPEVYDVTWPGGPVQTIPAADMLHLFGNDPGNPLDGVSPLEAFRRVIAEDAAAGEYREQFWRNAARIPGYLTRPVEAPKWSDPARTRFSEDWRARWSGNGGEAGGTPILEEGMEFHDAAFSAKDSEYIAARKLSREEAAALYHVPPAFVGILDQTNFANMKEQHLGLYVDTLGPWMDFVTTELEAQLLPDLDDVDGVYLDFTFEEKLRGDFEAQAAALSQAVGAPIMLRDEARAIRNLPPLPNGEGQQIVTPLNVLVGGLASPMDTDPTEPTFAGRGAPAKAGHQHGTKAGLPRELRGWEAKHAEVLQGFFRRQRDAVGGRLGAGSPLETAWDADRWDTELGTDLLALAVTMTDEVGGAMAAQMGGDWSPERAHAWLAENARVSAESINAATRAEVAAALGTPRAASRRGPGWKAIEDVLAELDGLDLLDDETDDDPTDPLPSVADVFEVAITARAFQIATTRATGVGQFARREGAEQSGARTKTWNVNASPSRHADLDGETVGIAEEFSNGAAWPGDPILGADENAGCLCSLSFGS